ncbi:hypothetical protein DXT93_32115 [Agrobacterium rhizogenes]|nr:hypothetical protein [Rhizobium rhizogenes]
MTSGCPLMPNRTDDEVIRWLVFALTPRSLFIAYTTLSDHEELIGDGAEDLLERFNGHVVSRSFQLVFAFDDRFKPEVEGRMRCAP